MVFILLSVFAFVLLKSITAVIDDAYQTQVRATAFSLRRAVLAAREQWFVQGKPTTAESLKGYGRGDLIMSATGWPVDATGAPDSAERNSAGTDFRCRRLWHALLNTVQKPDLRLLNSAPYDTTENDSCWFVFTLPGPGKKTAEIEYRPQDGSVNYFIR